MQPAVNLWSNRNIAAVGSNPNAFMFIRELLRPEKWSLTHVCNSVEAAVHAMSSREASLLVIDDTDEWPAYSILRQFFSKPMMFGFPAMVMLGKGNGLDRSCIEHFGEVEVMEKPLTPSRFGSSFSSLLRRWEVRPFAALRNATERCLAGEYPTVEARMEVLTRLSGLMPVAHLVVPMLAIEHFKMGQVAEAERILLQQLKVTPSHLAAILTLADIYMRSAVPHLGRRLFNSAHRLYPRSNGLISDAAQAEIVDNNFPAGISLLRQLLSNGYWVSVTEAVLARVLFAQGLEAEAESVLSNRKAYHRDIVRAWGT